MLIVFTKFTVLLKKEIILSKLNLMIEFGKGKIVFKVGKPTNIPLCCQLQSTHEEYVTKLVLK